MKKRAKPIQLFKATITVSLILVILGTFIHISASDSDRGVNPLPSDIDRSTDFDRKYISDKDFKETVDEIRLLLFQDDFKDEDWLKFQKLFNKIRTKLGRSTLDEMNDEELAEFRKAVEDIADDMRLLRDQTEYKDEISTRMSDSEEIELAEDYVHRMFQPEDDILYPALNGVWKIYVDVFDGSIYGHSLPGYYIIETTIVWFDEDDPTIDDLWDTFREITWGRIEDIETIFIVVTKSTEVTNRVSFQKIIVEWGPYERSFGGIYSGSNTWNNAAHKVKKLYAFAKVGQTQHPKLWVNTWNHAIGGTDNNPGMDDTQHDLWLWNLYHGNRLEAENDVSTFTYEEESMPKAP